MAPPYAMFVASLLFVSVAASAPISGTFASIAAGASGTTLTIDRAGGPLSLKVASEVVVTEERVGAQAQRVSLLALKAGEPLTIVRDGAGEASEIDARYAVVDTRAVVVENGYLVGTDGVPRKLVASAAAVRDIPLGAYVELRTDPATGYAFDAAVAARPFAGAVKAQVAVTFAVRVPVNTPPDATVYLATNAQNWTANAIRMAPQPGNTWMATVTLAGGTVLQYKYTRGSWATAERDPSGADIQNRALTVKGDAKAQTVHDVVARWADLSS